MKARFFRQKSTGKWLQGVTTGDTMGDVDGARLSVESTYSLPCDVTVVEVETDGDRVDALRKAKQWKAGRDGLPVVSVDPLDSILVAPPNPPGERQLRRERIIAGRGTPEGDAVYDLAMLTGALGLIEEVEER